SLLAADPSLIDQQIDEWTPLRLAVEYGRFELTRVLTDHSTLLNAVTGGFRTTPLHLAAERGRAEIITLLIERGADPNIGDVNRETPLFYVKRGDCDSLERLLRGGANLEVRNNGDKETVLEIAARNGEIETVKLLLDYGADVKSSAGAL